jgi:hypothetical protein
MPLTNLYFNNYAHTMEQRLIEDLIIESIKIYGIEVCYLPRTVVNEDYLFGEDNLSEYEHAYGLEAYIKNVDGFEGDGDFLSKFGLEIRDEMTLTISQRRFTEEVPRDYTSPNDTGDHTGRPTEGDLVYFPLTGKLYEVKFVEHEAIFYQMGALQTYDLRLELFQYSHEKFDTGVAAIDNIETTYSGVMDFTQVLLEDGTGLLTEDGGRIVSEQWRLEDTDKGANNEYFTTQTTDVNLNFVDWSESNPFGDL